MNIKMTCKDTLYIKCHLACDGYSVNFLFGKHPTHESHVKVVVEIIFDDFQIPTLQSQEICLSIKEITNLIAYFDGHIANLASNPNHISGAFVSSELDFTVQAFAGDVLGTEEDSFTLCFKLCIGVSRQHLTRVYNGVEGTVSVSSIKEFKEALITTISNINNLTLSKPQS